MYDAIRWKVPRAEYTISISPVPFRSQMPSPHTRQTVATPPVAVNDKESRHAPASSSEPAVQSCTKKWRHGGNLTELQRPENY